MRNSNIAYIAGIAFALILDGFRASAQSFNPMEMFDPIVTGQNINWNYNMGYRFTPSTNGNITHLGGKWRSGITHTVRLYAYPAGTLLASASVLGTGDYAYTAITSVNVSSGSTYVVAVRLDAQASGMYSLSATWPDEHGGIKILGSNFLNASNNMPTNLYTDRVYGYADVTFAPCVYAGKLTAEDEEIVSGSTTTLTVENPTNSIIWQSSSDGTNFSTISGQSGSQYTPTSIDEDTYYRTVVTAGSCSDTSEVLKVSVIDPFYPLRTEDPTLTAQNINWNYNMGYRFTADVDGEVTKLGGRWTDGVTHTVRLYNYPAGTVLATATISGSIDWKYQNITPVSLTAGNQYVVAVRLNSQSSGCYGPSSFPVQGAGVTLDNASYIFNTDNMPTNTITTYHYGMADLYFEPCVYAGTLVPDENPVQIYDSTTINVVQSTGTVTWQTSSDGVNYTTQPGLTGTSINSGAISQDVYYRTITTSACGSDTSDPLFISALYPGYLLQALNPGITAENVNWNFNMGYRFTPEVNGNVTELGGAWTNGVSHTVRLYDYTGGGTQLASTSVTGNGTWNYSSITPVALTGGNTYVVAVRLDAQSSGRYGALVTPQDQAKTTVHGATYVNASNAMPTNLITTFMYGFADLRYEPCVFAGEPSATDTVICPNGSSTLSTINFSGTLQWQSSADDVNFTDVSGATDSVYAASSIANTTFYRVIASDACGNDTSASVKVRVLGAGGTHGLWAGIIDTDWNNACNWDDGVVPSNGDSIFIPSGTNVPGNMPAITLDYLELNNPSGLLMGSNVTITDSLNIINGKLKVNNSTLTLTDTCGVSAAFSLGYIELAGSGQVRKMMTGASGPHFFPVGDADGYTEISITFAGGTFGGGAYISLTTTNSTHPNVSFPGNYIERYWTLGGFNITTPVYNMSCVYDQSDVFGAENRIYGQFYNGSSWTQLNQADILNNQLTSPAAFTVFGDITGYDAEAISSDQSGPWSSTSTWVGGNVPLATDHAIIKNSHIVTLTGNTTIGGLIIESGGTLNSAGNQVQIQQNLDVEGTFAVDNRVTFNGSSHQTIETGAALSFDTLIVDNSSGVELSEGAIEINGRLDIDAGTFTTNDAVTLLSSASWTANLAEVNGSISGQLTAQRYLDGLGSFIGYRHFSSPFQSSTLADYIYNAATHPGGIYMFGFTGSNLPSWNWANIYSFNEAAAGAGVWDDGWTAASNVTNPIGYAIPYTMYTGGSNYPTYNLSVTGYPNVGAISVSNLTNTSGLGWHMIGNPYASSLDWSAVTRTNVDANAYVYSETISGYTATSLLSPANQIASYQALFVHVTSAVNNITFNENDKVNNSADFQKSGGQNSLIRIEMNDQSSGYMALAAIDRKPDATTQFDSEYDAYHLTNPGPLPNLAIFSNDDPTLLQISTIPDNMLEYTFHLRAWAPQSGNYSLDFQRTAQSAGCILLEDLELDSIINLKTDSSYSFYLNTASDPNRFLIHTIYLDDASEVSAVSCFGESDGSIKLELGQLSFYDLTLKDNAGGVLSSLGSKSGTQIFDQLVAGNYSVEINDVGLGCPATSIAVEVFEPLEVISAFDAPDTHLLKDGSIQFTNQSQNSTIFNWEFGDGATSTDVNPIHEYQNAGSYSVSLISTEGLCSDTSNHMVSVVGEQQPIGLNELDEGLIKTYFFNETLHILGGRPLGSVTLIDMNGRLVHKQFDIGENELHESLDLPPGVYILEVKNETVFRTKLTH